MSRNLSSFSQPTATTTTTTTMVDIVLLLNFVVAGRFASFFSLRYVDLCITSICIKICFDWSVFCWKKGFNYRDLDFDAFYLITLLCFCFSIIFCIPIESHQLFFSFIQFIFFRIDFLHQKIKIFIGIYHGLIIQFARKIEKGRVRVRVQIFLSVSVMMSDKDWLACLTSLYYSWLVWHLLNCSFRSRGLCATK